MARGRPRRRLRPRVILDRGRRFLDGEHERQVTVFVPHYTMSGGTLLALAADEIAMKSTHAALDPIDPQRRARGFGLPVTDAVPELVYQLMDRDPQAGGGKPSVTYVPLDREADPSPAEEHSPTRSRTTSGLAGTSPPCRK